MNATLNRQVRSLERRTRSVRHDQCAECGWPVDGPIGQITLVVPMPRVMGVDEPIVPDPARDACPECGRVLVLHVPPPMRAGVEML
ncbi:MAG: hypothetical protein AB7G11_17595 [Phycisphaerales bacterium]